NGTVNAAVLSGGTLYIGGAFTQVGPATGGGVPIDATNGAPVSGFPKVLGSVAAVAPDGSGGWYIGGSFTSVGGISRSNIAHVLPDHSVSAWNPNADGAVSALAVRGTTLYVGGIFGSIGGEARNYLAALDAATGFATAWNPNAKGGCCGVEVGILALAVSGTTIYAAGDITSIGGQTRSSIAALDAVTGLATPWNPEAGGLVLTLAVSGTTVYAGGQFNSVGGQARNNLAALDATTGLATAWNPNATGPSGGYVSSLAVSGTTVYAGGAFAIIGGQARNYLAALDATTGLATAWDPNASGPCCGPTVGVLALAVNGT